MQMIKNFYQKHIKSKCKEKFIKPLRDDSASFQTAKIVFSNSYIKVVSSLSNSLFFSIFAVAGIAVIILGSITRDYPERIFAIIFGIVFTLVGLSGIFIPKFIARPEFDLLNKKFYPKGKKKYLSSLNSNERLEIPLNEFKFLRILEKVCSSGDSGSYFCYELNIVISDDERYNLLNHGNLSKLYADAEKLAKILNLPLVNIDNQEYIFEEKTYYRKRRIEHIVLFAVGVCFFGIGSFLYYHATIKPVRNYLDSASWAKVSAVVIDSAVKYDGDGVYSLNIIYQYNFNNQEYKSDNYDFFRGGSHSSNIGVNELWEIQKSYPVGEKFLALVNPENPEEAAIARVISSNALFLILFSGIFPIIGFVIIVCAVIGLCKCKKNKI